MEGKMTLWWEKKDSSTFFRKREIFLKKRQVYAKELYTGGTMRRAVVTYHSVMWQAQ
jgi:hypothetical protein